MFISKWAILTEASNKTITNLTSLLISHLDNGGEVASAAKQKPLCAYISQRAPSFKIAFLRDRNGNQFTHYFNGISSFCLPSIYNIVTELWDDWFECIDEMIIVTQYLCYDMRFVTHEFIAFMSGDLSMRV